MNKLFIALSMLFAVVHGFSHVQKNIPNPLPSSVGEVTFADGNFTGTNGFTITKSGTGFVADATYENGFNISDTTSYLEIAPSATTAIAGEHGFSIALNLSSKAGITTDNYEQLFTMEAPSGKLAFICIAGVYYMPSASGTLSYSLPVGGNKLTIDEVKKYQVFTIDFDNGTIYNYVNGALINQFSPDNNKPEVIANVINTFKELQTEGQSFFLRKPCSKRTNKNTTSIIAGDIKIFDSVLTPKQIEELSSKQRNDLPITVASCDDCSVSSIGYGVVPYTSDKPNSFNINDTTSFVSFKAAEDKKLTQNEKGFSLSFYHKTTTDTFYQDDSNARPNVTDDFEQLLTVEDGTGASAHICTGGMYYSEDGTDSTYATPRPNDVATTHVLLTTEWKYVTINVDSVNFSVIIYVNGEKIQVYDQSHNTRAAMIKTVVTMFGNAVSSNGGEIFLRKPFPLKVKRNSATNIFDEMVFDECLDINAIKALHDSKLGRIRVIFAPNIDVSFDDIVGNDSITIPPYSFDVDGYTFMGLYFDEAHTQKVPDNYVTTESLIVYPYFAPIKYTITYHLDGGTNNPDNPTEFSKDQKIVLLDASKEGYVFMGWYRTDKFENKVTIIVEGSYGDIDLYARFERNVYKITYVLNGGLLAGDAIETFTADDDNIVLPNAWKPGKAFIGWYRDEEMTQKVTSIDTKCGHDVTVYALFADIYNITYILNGGTLCEGAVTTFTIYDGVLNLPNATKEGFVFDGWYKDAELTQKVEQLDTSIAEDITLYAKFSEKTPESQDPDEPEEPKEENNLGLILGLSIGGGVALAGAAVFIILMIRRKRV